MLRWGGVATVRGRCVKQSVGEGGEVGPTVGPRAVNEQWRAAA